MNKTTIVAGLVLCSVLMLGVYIYRDQTLLTGVVLTNAVPAVAVPVAENVDTVDLPNMPIAAPEKQRTATFSGILEQVNIGCFADGVCSVVVDGKTITTLVGRRQEIVGKVEGVVGFGDLENFIGTQVDVYAQDLSNNTYSLYGNEGFYIKLRNAGGATAQMGIPVNILGLQITPLQVLEDSRCPIDVECIQAGTLRLRAMLEDAAGSFEQVFVLGESITIETAAVKLVAVDPITDSQTTIGGSEYVFHFVVKQNSL